MSQDDDSKHRLALAATKLFLKRGFTGAPMAQIVETSGLSQEEISGEFAGKEAILLYILKQLQNSLREHVFSIADDTGLDQGSRLEKMNNLLKDYFLDNKGCLIAAMGMDSEVLGEETRKMLKDIFQDWKTAYKKIFCENFTEQQADVMATNAILFIEGAIVWLRVTGEEKNLIRVFEDIQGYLPASS